MFILGGICNIWELGSFMLMVLATCWFSVGLRLSLGWFRVCLQVGFRVRMVCGLSRVGFGIYLGLV